MKQTKAKLSFFLKILSEASGIEIIAEKEIADKESEYSFSNHESIVYILRSIEINNRLHSEIVRGKIVLKKGIEENIKKYNNISIYNPTSYYSDNSKEKDKKIIVEIKEETTNKAVEGVLFVYSGNQEMESYTTNDRGEVYIYINQYDNDTEIVDIIKPGYNRSKEILDINYYKNKYTFYLKKDNKIKNIKINEANKKEVLKEIVEKISEKTDLQIICDEEIENMEINLNSLKSRDFLELLEEIRLKYELEYGYRVEKGVYLKKSRIKTGESFRIQSFEENGEVLKDAAICVDGNIDRVKKINFPVEIKLPFGKHKIYIYKSGYVYKEIEVEVIPEEKDEKEIIVKLNKLIENSQYVEKILIEEEEYYSNLILPENIKICGKLPRIAEALSILYDMPILVEESAKDIDLYIGNFNFNNSGEYKTLKELIDFIKKIYYLEEINVDRGIILKKKILKNEISGVVLDSDKMTKIKGVEIIADGGKIRFFTDEKGEFKIKSINPGVYEFFTYINGYKEYKSVMVVKENSVENYQIVLEKTAENKIKSYKNNFDINFEKEEMEIILNYLYEKTGVKYDTVREIKNSRVSLHISKDEDFEDKIKEFEKKYCLIREKKYDSIFFNIDFSENNEMPKSIKEFEQRITETIIPLDIKFNKVKLEYIIKKLSKNIVIAEDINKMEIDIEIPSGSSIETVLEKIKEKYNLVNPIKEYKYIDYADNQTKKIGIKMVITKPMKSIGEFKERMSKINKKSYCSSNSVLSSNTKYLSEVIVADNEIWDLKADTNLEKYSIWNILEYIQTKYSLEGEIKNNLYILKKDKNIYNKFEDKKNIIGKIIEKDSKTEIKDAKIICESRYRVEDSVNSDKNGRFIIKDMGVQNYILLVYHPDYYPSLKIVNSLKIEENIEIEMEQIKIIKIKEVKFKKPFDFKGERLENVVKYIYEESGVKIEIAEEIKDYPIDIYLPANQQLEKILKTITEYNRLKIIDTEKELRLEVNNTVY